MISCSIIPAYVYKNILDAGNSEQKSFAREVLDSLNSFVSDRKTVLASFINSADNVSCKSRTFERKVYDAENKTTLPGKLVRSEGEKTNKDVSVEEAYDGSGKTWEFFKKFFDRDSIDDKGMGLVSTVHYGRKYPNAFWNGKQMTYGDGDGQIFNRFTSALDVIGHEISHGITERTAGLEYYSQSGALNEHFSDVFGSCIKQYARGQSARDADWIIGEGLFTKNVDGVGIRSMKAPGTAYDDERLGKDPQPNHWDRYNKTESDNFGVHINSSIPNLAFYHTAVNLGGESWSRAGQIWYKTLTTKLKPTSQFNDFARAVVSVAGDMYGTKSIEQKAVIDGLKQVGLPHA